MAKCELSIELDEADRFHEANGIISGVVHVTVDADVRCKGLEVESVWRTHGRGNVATGTNATETLFQGEWQGGNTFSYRFDLPISGWPPTYHGHFLNVDHYVDARAHIPWAFDPKDSAPFRVRPQSGGSDLSMAAPTSASSDVARIIVVIFAITFSLAILTVTFFTGPFALLVLIFPAAGFLFWFIRKFLPRWLLGEVSCDFLVDTVSPGEMVEGELKIRPNKSVAINAITLRLQSLEKVVSGSGSNRTTHKHVIHDQTILLQDSSTLSAGETHCFPLRIDLPEDAAFSLDLSDNKLLWNATLRVDIPRWPDWVQEIPVAVVPPEQLHRVGGRSSLQSDKANTTDQVNLPASEVTADAFTVPASIDNEAAEATEPAEAAGQGVTFDETVNHFWRLRDQRSEVETLAEAVSGLTLEMEARIERRLLYGGADDPHVYKDGYAVWARYTDPPLPMVLYVPHDFADDFEQIGHEIWRGFGTIVGWDGVHGRLQIKIERP